MIGSEVPLYRFGVFELDTATEQLRKNGVTVRLQPQPYKLLRLLVETAGRLVTREEIRAALWADDTFVDFDQGVNFAMKQVREALADQAERPVFIQTVPKRGYRFLAPVEVVGPRTAAPLAGTDPRLHKALWANIVELRLAEERRRKRQTRLAVATGAAAVLIVVLIVVLMLFRVL